MSKVLYIKANSKPSGESRTFKIADSFIEAYKQANPEDEIITLDLYQEAIGFLTFEQLSSMDISNIESATDYPVLKYAFQFLQADKYIIAEPLWNLSVPAILKAYIDYICINKVTFKYTAQGPVGLCLGKKAINITTRGGKYSEGRFQDKEMGNRYLKSIFDFLGIKNFTTVCAESLDAFGNDVNAILESSIKEAQEIAKTF